MNVFKDYLLATAIVALLLVTAGVLDDSYEDALLSAQVLDECIAQAQNSHETGDLNE
jgi:hypothetical protein